MSFSPLAEQISHNQHWDPNGRLLIGLSGGADSVALLHLLLELGYRPGIVHCNFRLRGAEADGDEAFVNELANLHELPRYMRSFDTARYAAAEKLSIQMAARQLRYNFFDELLANEPYDYLATAHHLDDQAETILYHLMRGKSFAVLSGIPEMRGPYIRPLITIRKQQLLAYLKERKLPHREDSSNATGHYLRNQIRHHVLPALEQINPSAATQLAERLQLYSKQFVLIEAMLDEAVQACWHVEASEIWIDLGAIAEWASMKGVGFSEVFLHSQLEQLGFTYNDIQQTLRLLDAQTGRHLRTAHYQVTKDRNRLVIRPLLTPSGEMQPQEMREGVTYAFGDMLVILEKASGLALEDVVLPPPKGVIWLDADSMAEPFTLRPWRHADKLMPMGMNGKQKVSDILTDLKIPAARKNDIPVIADRNGVVAVSYYRIAERSRLTAKTQNIVQVTFLEAP